MAEAKEYGYYIEGNKIAIVQRDTSFDNDANSRDYGPGSDKFQWKSPLEAIDQGIELQYSYSPEYKELNSGSRVSSQPVSYKGAGATGNVRFDLSNGIDWSSYIGQYILLFSAGRWNGIHKIAANSTVDVIYTETPYSDADNTSVNFESGIQYSTNVSFMEDESYNVDLPVYLQKALVSYLKSRLFEDIGKMDMKDYYYKEFTRQLEKHNNSKVSGVRMIIPGANAIK
tara:strand:+ start:1242 stop:1925 length:684 start_codon:yes stop_codon:yes gene_type:complete